MRSSTSKLATLPCLAMILSGVAAQTCTLSVSGSVPSPSVASGFVAQLVATNLPGARGIAFDSEDNLLVVLEGTGISALTFQDDGGSCMKEKSRRNVLTMSSLNHGIQISGDSKTLYASSSDSAYSWAYNASSTTALQASDGTVLVQGMTGSDHTSRTLQLSERVPGMLLVNRGSYSNVDPDAKKKSSGHSQVKAFDVSKTGSLPYTFDTDGTLMGWGLRNDVGIAEEPSKGGIYTVENSVDQMMRNGKDIHEDNPGEELNFLGYLDKTSPNQGRNFGYPTCFAAWDVLAIPKNKGLKVGMQFSIGNDQTLADNAKCQADYQAPRLTFQAHMAPLDILFNNAGSEAWITFHGSWNRNVPAGYKVGVVGFANGEPSASSTSKTALIDIVSNQDTNACPGNCFRPVGLAWDSKGRLFFSDDYKGSIYVITAADGSSLAAKRTISKGVDSGETNAANSAHGRAIGVGWAAGLMGWFLAA